LANERQLGVDRAQYQAEGMSRLAQGEFAQSGRMADAMRQSRLDIADVEMATAQNMSDAYMATSQYYTGMVGDYARDIADAQFGGAQALSNLDVTTGRDLTSTAMAGAQLVGRGLEGMTAQREKQFATNQYEPYVRQREFMINELRRLDPWAVETQMFGDLIGMGHGAYVSGVSGQAQTATNMGNVWANTASGAGANLADRMPNQVAPAWGDLPDNYLSPFAPRVTGGNYTYDDPWEGK